MASPKLISVMLMFVTTMICINVMIVGAAKTWCVAKEGADTQALISAINYACGAGADCGPIQPGGLCYNPNTIQSHASYAFDSYYQMKKQADGSCDFGGSATIVNTEPSYGKCVYPSF
uniref:PLASMODESMATA CALLOSE-BINDING PROTEIN 3-like n=2 Tax=Cicer arietinum TaxID=3827 RepID=A0A1S2YGE5_CICAR|nr:PLASMODESMATA CALLOSE-BINDING PROTEIN 3-like [Cicer arietinum]XP_004504428.1 PLASMODESMATA CALLOSE-BINDING PROTEIN 3-like [Cicer arietinum]